MRHSSLLLGAAFALLGTAAVAQQPHNLTRVQLIALQQQMRDDGCAVKHVTITWDAPTRQGLACEKKRLNVTGGPLDVLYAMDIGFKPTDNPPQGAPASDEDKTPPAKTKKGKKHGTAEAVG